MFLVPEFYVDQLCTVYGLFCAARYMSSRELRIHIADQAATMAIANSIGFYVVALSLVPVAKFIDRMRRALRTGV
jgi:hypothetical protein